MRVETATGRVSVIRFDVGARERLLVHCRAELPNEACGLLLGGEGLVADVAPARNVAASDRRRHFEIDPRDFIAADSFAREHGLGILGSYHSHPDRAAEPSDVDLAAAQEGWLHLIVGRPGDATVELRCWRLERGRFVEEPIG